MRRPYYNYWTYAHGDAPPDENEPGAIFYMAPSKYAAVLNAGAAPHLNAATAVQRFEEQQNKKDSCLG